MKTNLLLLSMLFIGQSLFCQNYNGTASGVIEGRDDHTVVAATIELCKLPDTLLIKTQRSDSGGKFLFRGITGHGEYILRISSGEYKNYVSPAFRIDSNHTFKNFNLIVMERKDAVSLKEVVVSAKKPLLEQQIDRMIVNVDAMIGAPGSNALEILEKTPGVTVEMAGGISLNGKNSVLVMIDGRPTHLSSNDLAAYLKSLPGGTLDKIELIDNPPARYEAGGSAIVNIILKKNKLQGFTGLISAGYNQGVYGRNNNSLMINFNRKKLNISSSFGYNRDEGFNSNAGTRSYFDENGNPESSLGSVNESKNYGSSLNGRLAIDYAFNSKTSYGFIYSLNRRSSHDDQLYTNVQFNNIKDIDSTSVSMADNDAKWSGASYNFNFLHKFNNEGRELSADINYIGYRNRGIQNLRNIVTSPDNPVAGDDSFVYYLPSDINIYTGQVDYMHPLPGKARIDAGFKSGYVINDNELSFVGDALPSGSPSGQPGYDKSNHFVYRETITAFYVSARKEWKRFSVQGGLRLENTNSDGNQFGNTSVAGSRFAKNYTNAFPSFFFSYKLDTNNINFIDLSYSRRIRRANYQMLNPFLFFVDNYSYTAGNPLLIPQTAHQLEIKYRYKKYFGIGFQQTFYNDVIFQISKAEDKIFITSPENVARGAISALNVNSGLPVTKWWNLNLNGNLLYLHLMGSAHGVSLEQKTYTYRASVLNQFTISSTFTAELNGFYSGKDLSGQRIIDPRYRINTGVQKKILKGKGSVRLTIEDIFYSWKQKDVTINLNRASAANINVSDTRRVGIGFTYSFGKDSSKKKRTLNENSAQEEKTRVD